MLAFVLEEGLLLETSDEGLLLDTSDEGLLLDTPDVDDLMPALVVEGGIVLDINVYRFLCT